MRRILISLALMALVFTSMGIAGAQTKYDTFGPKVDEIIMPIIKDGEARLIAFERGETVVNPGMAQAAQIDRLKANPNSEITMSLGYHMFYLGINVRNEPLKADVLRQAMAHCTDRDNIIRNLFAGYMMPLSSFLPPSSPFFKADVPVFAYNPRRAAEILDRAGYRLDPATRVRIDPKTGKPLREMTILTPTMEVAATSAQLGVILADAFRAVGLPVKAEPMDFNVMLSKLDNADFDMYVLAWSGVRLPTSLYNFFHSSNDVIAGFNRPGIRDAELDKALERAFYPPDYATAKAASDAAQLMLARLMPYVPLYSRPIIDAWRKDLVTGFVPMLGHGASGAYNKWTQLNIRRTAGPGGTIRWVLQEEPQGLNPITSSSAYSWDVMAKLFDYLIESDPNTAQDIPWMAKKWDVGTWTPQPGKTATVITLHLNDGIKWHDGMPFTSADVKFSLEYLRDKKAPRYLANTRDIVKVEAPDKLTVKVYFSTLSYWNIYHATINVLPKHIYEKVDDFNKFQPWLEPHPTVPGLTKLIGTGPFMLREYRTGEYVRLVKNPNYWRLNP